MAEDNGRPFALLSQVQGDAIRHDVVLLEALVARRIFRFSHLTLQQACNNGGRATSKVRREIADVELGCSSMAAETATFRSVVHGSVVHGS